MANTSLDQFIDTLHGTLGYANNTGSVNLYMAHGGTNFGFTAGAFSTSTMPVASMVQLMSTGAVSNLSVARGPALGITCFLNSSCIHRPHLSASTACGSHEGGAGDDISYQACITSYDYDAPISEAGDYGQPGIGGPNKFVVRMSPFTLCPLTSLAVCMLILALL